MQVGRAFGFAQVADSISVFLPLPFSASSPLFLLLLAALFLNVLYNPTGRPTPMMVTCP